MDSMIKFIPKGALDIFSKVIIFRYFYVSFVIFFLYNLPIILIYRLLLFGGTPSPLKNFLWRFFNTFYKSPMYLILYFYTNSSLKKFIKEVNPNNTNPNHYFQTLVINTFFTALYLVYLLLPYPLNIIPSALINSIYISQLAYKFIDSDEYSFNNSITYYNSNSIFFLTLGGIFTIIENKYLVESNLEILGLFFYILFIFPILALYPYRNNDNSYNIFYSAELIINFMLSFF